MLFDRRVHRNDRRAGSRRPLTRYLDDETVASLVPGLRLVLVTRQVELLQLAVGRLLRNLRVVYRAAYPDRE